MHTINKQFTFTAPVTVGNAVEAFRIKVVNQQKVSIHAYTEQSDVRIQTQYVFIDPITGEETFADYTEKALVASELMPVIYPYKVDHMRVIYHTNGAGTGSKTLHITGTTSE